VLFVIRTAGSQWSNRPSVALTATAATMMLIGIFLPFSPVSLDLGFVSLRAAFFLFLAVATGTYLALVEVAKRRLIVRLVG
jgi:Mg2+-importing ATPase